ncbi:MAG: M23 family metallopeptidase [bacterium]|nr:M23 family metallopeptidase [bacterium]
MGLAAIRSSLAAFLRRLGKWAVRGLRRLRSVRALLATAALGAAFAIGVAASQLWWSDSGDPPPVGRAAPASTQPVSPQPDDGPAAPQATAAPTPPADGPVTATPQAGTTPTPADAGPSPTPTPAGPGPSPTPVFAVLDQEPQTYQEALEDAARLSAETVLPSSCMSPLPHPELLPNASRTYRSGIHQGVDFRCFDLGHPAVAALDGRAAAVIANYEDPEPGNRNGLLEIAAQLNATPPFTLLTLYGNYVVIDHGIIADVGHVVTIYAHLEEVDPDIRVGELVKAGQRVGEIGNRGTHAAANGDFYADPHLHWELHVDNQYLGAGLSVEETRDVYSTLFSQAS